MGALCITSRQSLATSQTKSCINSGRISARRLHFCKLLAPPSNPQPTPWGEPSGSSNPNGDDQEVTFPRGGGGFPQANHPISCPSLTRWRVGSSGSPPQPPRPAPANPDVGCLISNLALGLHLGTPRTNTFSGEAMPGKAEVSFEQWNHEIQCN